ILGALIGLGVDRDELVAEISKLGLTGYEIKVERVDRSGISSIHVDVIVPEEKAHRHLRHILEIVNNSELSDGVKARMNAIFTRLAEAEAKVHGTDVEKVHFHEVGAMDAIIDVAGACIGFEMLGIERFVCSKIHTGSGFVQMEHGKFPVPPPAVSELLKDIPIYSTEIEGELITPTGAAIISTLCDSYGALPELKVERTGYGAGTRTYEGFPNVLRLFVGTAAAEDTRAATANITEDLLVLESNLDDATPQVLGYLMDRSLELGALDCWFTPVQMKKNRPGILVSILCRRGEKVPLAELLYRETTTIGIRVRGVQRESLPREVRKVSTMYGTISVKTAYLNGETVNVMPEYDDVAAAATEHGVPFNAVWEAALAASRIGQSAGA
ncbi:MAG TPA: nickel pincer cofactor biosynthesis protein LarC, partial [Pyrinomonadaceae bacterium]|nr:nickel pincer cofactor biosynthesis protein LarC [Pyrinomonadaceae bacterium]